MSPETPGASGDASSIMRLAKRLMRTQPSRMLAGMAAFAVLALSLNLLVSWYASSQGYWWSLFSLFGRFDHALGDYFKSMAPLPGAESIEISHYLGLKTPILHAREHWYQPGMSNLHSPPMIMSFFLVNLAAMKWVNPAICFYLVYLALLGYWWRLASRYARDAYEAALWIALLLVSYPTLVMIIRGNIMAGITATCIIHSMLLCARGRAPVLAAFLLAVAVNFRPNAIVFAVPLLLLQHREYLKAGLTLGVAGAVVFAAALLLAHHLHPQYDLAAFRDGLALYYQRYVIEDYGLENGSSLYGALKLLVGGYRPGLDLLACIPSAVLAITGAWLYLLRRMPPGALVFVYAAVYALGSAVFADYHLMVFLAVPLVIAGYRGDAPLPALDRMAVIGACLVLVPKNYVYVNEVVSLQVLLNPLILLFASSFCILYAVLRPAGRADALPEKDPSASGITR